MRGEQGEYALLYDGSCGLCRATVELLSCFPMRARVVLVNAADPRQLARYPQIPPQQAMQSVHLVMPSGNYVRGYDAIVVLVGLMRVFRCLRPLMNTPAARKGGWAAYEWVTAHRHRISRLLFLE